MSVLAELIKKLEKATGPDRELDAAIWLARGLTEQDERRCREWCKMDGRTDLTRERFIAAWAPLYTSSLDAALSLIPEGLRWGVSRSQEPTTPQPPKFHGWGMPMNSCLADDEFEGRSEASTAIALAVACLRAREGQ